MERLEGRVALVTGAGSGIGRAASLAFAAEGAGVMCADIDEAAAQDTAARVAELGGRSAATRLDVAVESEVERALAGTVAELGALGVLFNNAGIGGGRGWEATLDVNLSGVYYGLKHGAPLIEANGGGSIVNTSSVAGLVGLVGAQAASGEPLAGDDPGGASYVASKHGVVGLTRQFALHYARRGVRVNCVNPGYIDTPMIGGATADARSRGWLESLHPMGRLGRAEEVAAAVLFLASDDSSFVTGTTLVVDGGYAAR